MWGDGGIYQRWAEALDRWQAGEPVDLAALPEFAPGDLPGDGFERLANRVTAALSRRLQVWADALTRSLSHAADEFAVGKALVEARQGLRPIRALAAHDRLPAELASRLLELINAEIRSAQQALEDQVEAMRRGGADRRAVEARRRTIRDSSLSTVVAEDPAAGTTGWLADPATPPRRRIIGG